VFLLSYSIPTEAYTALSELKVHCISPLVPVIPDLSFRLALLASKIALPVTSNFSEGLVAPIPILPEDSVIIESATAEVPENLAILLAVPEPVIPPEGKV
jgi:hypothetical protein